MLECREVVRAIPGKRLVCRGEWQGDDVFIKLYIGAEKLFRRELQGLKALHTGGIAAPAVRYSGTADEGAIHVILLEPVQPAMTLEAAWEAAADDAARIGLLGKAVCTIADHHRAGLEQRDIHLDNFLLSAGRLYTLDGGGIHVGPAGELSVKAARDNLALFFAQFYPVYDGLIDAVLPLYEHQRRYQAGSISAARLHQRVDYFRRRRQRRFLKKIFRDCSAFVCAAQPAQIDGLRPGDGLPGNAGIPGRSRCQPAAGGQKIPETGKYLHLVAGARRSARTGG